MDRNSGLPLHVAFIMDGNGRWAERRGLPRLDGHQSGVKNVRPIIQYLNDKGVKYVTLYAFSTENWNRPDDEVDGLFKILENIIGKEEIVTRIPAYNGERAKIFWKNIAQKTLIILDIEVVKIAIKRQKKDKILNTEKLMKGCSLLTSEYQGR